jgi:hypothetical protein
MVLKEVKKVMETGIVGLGFSGRVNCLQWRLCVGVWWLATTASSCGAAALEDCTFGGAPQVACLDS